MRDDPAYMRAIMEGMPDPSGFLANADDESGSEVEIVGETPQSKKASPTQALFLVPTTFAGKGARQERAALDAGRGRRSEPKGRQSARNRRKNRRGRVEGADPYLPASGEFSCLARCMP